jgi:outer membrane lipoprotein-sorting protein
MSETDVIRNGTSAWLWESTTRTVTRYQLTAGDKTMPAEPSGPAKAPLTPQQAASQVLAAVGPTTTVRVDSNVVVAGEAAYQLVLAPKDTRSLVGEVRIAVDGRNNVPLRVQVVARGASNPAIQVGFTSISFVKPAAANFAFTPPPGAKVVQQNMTPGKQGAPRSGQANGATTIGQGWLTVAVLPASAVSGMPGSAASAGDAASSAAHAAAGSPSAVSGAGPGDSGAILGALLRSATPVHGSWGSGHLLRTSLVSVLITSDGRVLAGAVAPSVLYSAAQSSVAQSSAAQKG